jgi:putative DNA methylase
MNKTIIEEGNFELIKLFYQVSEEATKEKNAIPPINEMLYWRTRKPLIVARAVALCSTLSDIGTIRYLLCLDKDKRAFNYIPNLSVYKTKTETDPKDITVLDPFCGAGNLLFEAKRLGLNCYGREYNPVAYLIMKSVLEYPGKYGNKLEIDFKKYGIEVIERTRKEIGKFFVRNGRKSLTYLWVWCIRCSYCQQRVPLTQHMWLLKTERKRIGVRFCPTDDLNFKVELIKDMDQREGKNFTQKRGKAICIRCRNSIDRGHMTNDLAKNRDRELIAIVVQDKSGKDYELPTDEDKQAYIESVKYLKQNLKSYQDHGWLPDEDIRASLTNSLINYGIKKWSQFYSERQLLVMLTLLKNIKQLCNEIIDKEYAKVIATYLSLLLCKQANYNSIGIYWHVSKQVIGSSLSFRRPTLIYNHAEVNPFERTSGAFEGMLNDFAKAIRFASSNNNQCNISIRSVLNPSPLDKHRFDLIITDPPYADDVQYGELSDFFYVWLYRALKEFYPELPNKVPIEEDISISLFRFGNLMLATDFYEKAMKEAFKQICLSLKDNGLLILFFAHSTTEAWNLLLEVLRESKLQVVSSYAIHTESTANPVARGRTSFMSSIIVACRKILEDSTVYFEDLIPKIEDKVKTMIMNLSSETLVELPITDLLIMTYGKVLEEATKHTILKSYKSDFKPEFENLIKDAREFILEEIVTKLTGRSPNMLGSDMSFYIVTKLFCRGILDSNEAVKIAWAYQIKIEDLEIRQIAKKESGVIKLMFFDQIHFEKKPDEIDRNSLHEQLLYLETMMDQGGISKVKNILSQQNNFRVQDIKQIVNLLVKSCRMRINKGESLNMQEQKELKILENLDDMFSSSISSGGKTLERFM